MGEGIGMNNVFLQRAILIINDKTKDELYQEMKAYGIGITRKGRQLNKCNLSRNKREGYYSGHHFKFMTRVDYNCSLKRRIAMRRSIKYYLSCANK
jgi:hypothetical protein